MARTIIDLPVGTSPEKIRIILDQAKAGVHEILATNNPKYDYVAVREVHAEIGRGTLRPGRSA